ncbi:hypothetical protein LTR29_014113 [Friedmanniomyces endolithicus]|nr:hypothetical protein LTR29_014113 [Friedmanniomyces endolithicus]
MMVQSLFAVFWLSFGLLQLPTLGLAAAYSPTGNAAEGALSQEYNSVIGLYLIVWGFALFTFWIFTLKTNSVFAGIFLLTHESAFYGCCLEGEKGGSGREALGGRERSVVTRGGSDAWAVQESLADRSILTSSVTIAAWVLAGAYFNVGSGNYVLAVKLQKAGRKFTPFTGGALLFIVAALGWYMTFVIMAAEMRLPVNLPVGDLSHFWPSTDIPLSEAEKQA